MPNYRALIADRPQFRLLWIAQIISLTGDWFNTIAIITLVNRYVDDSALANAGVFLARALPVFILSPLAGVVADRFDRKLILVASNWLRVAVVLGFLWVDSAADLWLIYVLTILQFGLSSFFEPAYAAILPSLVWREELLTANTLGSITWSVMLTVGAVIGGVVATVWGVEVALILDALTFALAGAIILLIRPTLPPSPATPSPSVDTVSSHLGEFVQGAVFLRQHPSLALVAMVKALTQIGTIDVAIAVYADRVFVVGDNGEATAGILFAAHGVGAVLGPVLGDAIGDGSERALKIWIGWGFAMVVVGWVIFGAAPTLAVATFGMVVRGMGGSINWTYSSVILQLSVPDAYLGRVFGIDFAVFTLALSGATVLMGFLIDTLGIDPRQAILLIAALSITPWALWVSLMRFQESIRARRQSQIE